MNNSGFSYAAEALIATIFLAIIIANFNSSAKIDSNKMLDELYLLQKEHDLLKIWIRADELKMGEITSDFNFMFSKNCGLIEIDDVKIWVNKEFFNEKQEAISAEANFYGKNKETKIMITVYH